MEGMVLSSGQMTTADHYGLNREGILTKILAHKTAGRNRITAAKTSQYLFLTM